MSGELTGFAELIVAAARSIPKICSVENVVRAMLLLPHAASKWPDSLDQIGIVAREQASNSALPRQPPPNHAATCVKDFGGGQIAGFFGHAIRSANAFSS